MKNRLEECTDSITEKHFFIEDGGDQKPAFISFENGEFEVTNNTNNSIYFLRTDSCLYNSKDPKRCDSVIYNDNTICFIELKCIKPKNFADNSQNAKEQIEETIINFQKHGILQDKKNREAFISLNCHKKKNGCYEPITKKPKNNTVFADFRTRLNTKLYYDTKKEFN